MEAARPMFPLLGMFFVSAIWVIYTINDIIDLEPRLYFVMCGTLFSNICVSIQKWLISFNFEILIFSVIFSVDLLSLKCLILEWMDGIIY